MPLNGRNTYSQESLAAAEGPCLPGPPPRAVTCFVVALVLAGPAVLQALVYFPDLTSKENASTTSIAIALSLVTAVYASMRYLEFTPTLLSFFMCASTLTAAVDFGIAGHLLGLWSMGGFYPKHGEKYFATSYGVAVLLWDGVVHTALQGFLAYRSILGLPLTPLGLVWAGSVINSMMPLLVGAASGRFSDQIDVATAMNAPYVIIPVILACSLFSRKDAARPPARPRGALEHACCLLLMASHAALVAVHTVRIIAVLGSKAAVARMWVAHIEPVLAVDDTNVLCVQSCQFFFYFGVYHCVAFVEMGSRCFAGRRFGLACAADWAALVLGGYAQALFTLSFMAIAHYRAPGDVQYGWLPAEGTRRTVVVAACTLVASLGQLVYFLRKNSPKRAD